MPFGPAPFSSTANAQAPDTLYAELSDGDAVRVRSTLQEALETRRSQEMVTWRSSATRTTGTVTPLRTFRIKNGVFCRDFRETLVTTDSLVEQTGTACRRADGVWIRVVR